MNSRIFKGLILAAGAGTLAVLLWKLDPQSVWELLRKVGWGWLVIIPAHGVDHIFNAWGWRFTFAPEHSGRVGLRRLYHARIAGDGVNYLTPSGTIAGEVVRPALLGPAVPEEARIASVVVAKFTQAIAQILFILIGVMFLLNHGLALVESARRWVPALGGLLVLACLGVAAFGLFFSRRSGLASAPAASWSLLSVRGQIADFFRMHPGRFALSTLAFVAGYAWGTVEVLLICRFLGVPISLPAALGVEVLSTMVDGMTFMVPAKIGTQEAGKTAIFAGLGLGAGAGFAFGVVRHLRELVWATAGLLLYTLHRRNLPAGPEAAGDTAQAVSPVVSSGVSAA